MEDFDYCAHCAMGMEIPGAAIYAGASRTRYPGPFGTECLAALNVWFQQQDAAWLEINGRSRCGLYAEAIVDGTTVCARHIPDAMYDGMNRVRR